MLVCNRCGMLIEDEELGFGYEAHGEKVADTCRCGGDFIEATKCDVCGEWFDNTDLNGVCEDCLNYHETVGEALELGENDKTTVTINGFVAAVLSEEQINKILERWVEENFTDRSKPVVEYCEDDKDYFADFVRDKEGK